MFGSERVNGALQKMNTSNRTGTYIIA